MREHRLALGLFGDQDGEAHLSALHHILASHRDPRRIEVQVVEGENTDMARSSTPPVLFSRAAGSHAFAAPGAIRNVPLGTVVSVLALSGVAWTWQDTAFHVGKVLLGIVTRRLAERHTGILAVRIAKKLRVTLADVRIVSEVHSQHFPTHCTLIEDHLLRSVGGLIIG